MLIINSYADDDNNNNNNQGAIWAMGSIYLYLIIFIPPPKKKPVIAPEQLAHTQHINYSIAHRSLFIIDVKCSQINKHRKNYTAQKWQFLSAWALPHRSDEHIFAHVKDDVLRGYWNTSKVPCS